MQMINQSFWRMKKKLMMGGRWQLMHLKIKYFYYTIQKAILKMKMKIRDENGLINYENRDRQIYLKKI